MTPTARATDTQTSVGAARLRSIDALRGAAALAVVLYHVAGQMPDGGAGGLFARVLDAAFRRAAGFGYAGVFLFFVISGFCIHLSQARARAAGLAARVEFRPFWRRRVRRLYPPYLAALLLSLAVAAATVGLPLTRHFTWDVASHLLMVHNFDPRTCYSISSVFWTLAVEEQLYLAYFLLLSLRGRRGWRATLAVCFAARAAWLALTVALRETAGVELPFAESAAAHWFAWALGALAVESAYGLVALPRWCRDLRVGAAALAAAAALAYAQDAADLPRGPQEAVWLLLHPAWSFGFFVLLNRAVASERGRARGFGPPRAFAWLAAVGVVSYSLYLTHPLVLLLAWRVEWVPLPPLAIYLLVVAPLCLAFAWLFFQLFERPFLARPARGAAAFGRGDAARPRDNATNAHDARAAAAEVVPAEV